MSTQVVRPAKVKPVPFMSAPKVKAIPPKLRPLNCKRKPGMVLEALLRELTWKMVEEHYGYEEVPELIRIYMINAAMMCCKDVKKHAAARLGISRYHLDNYLARGKELL